MPHFTTSREVRYALIGAAVAQAYSPHGVTRDVAAVPEEGPRRIGRELELEVYVLVGNPRLGEMEFKRRGKWDHAYAGEFGFSVPTSVAGPRSTDGFGWLLRRTSSRSSVEREGNAIYPMFPCS